MAKAYWVTTYRSVSDPGAQARYAALAGPAITAFGGRFLARGEPARMLEGPPEVRCVIVEFESVARAIAAFESPAYQEALAALGGSADRTIRIVEGV